VEGATPVARRRHWPAVVDLATLQPIADDAQGQEILALLAQDHP